MTESFFAIKDLIDLLKSQISKLIKIIEKALFIKTYALSDSLYRISQIQKKWHDLGPLQFCFYINSSFYKIQNDGNFLAIRTKNNQNFYKIEITINVEDAECSWQQNIVIYEVGSNPIKISLKDIPKLHL